MRTISRLLLLQSKHWPWCWFHLGNHCHRHDLNQGYKKIKSATVKPALRMSKKAFFVLWTFSIFPIFFNFAFHLFFQALTRWHAGRLNTFSWNPPDQLKQEGTMKLLTSCNPTAIWRSKPGSYKSKVNWGFFGLLRKIIAWHGRFVYMLIWSRSFMHI